MMLDRPDEGARLGPGVVADAVIVAGGEDLVAFRRIAGVKIGGTQAFGRGRHELHDQPAGAPGKAATGQDRADAQANPARNLLGLAEILVSGLFQALPVERDDALIARRIGALVDGHGEMALAQQFAGRDRLRVDRRREPVGVVAGHGTVAIGCVEIDDQHRDRPIALGLELETPLAFERGAEHDGQRRRLGEDARDGLGIMMPLQDLIERGTKPDDPAAYVEIRHGEGQHPVVGCARWRGVSHQAATPPKHQARMPFWACRRFSASSKTADCGPSMTSSVTSSPREAGRQCMKIASFSARPSRRSST